MMEGGKPIKFENPSVFAGENSRNGGQCDLISANKLFTEAVRVGFGTLFGLYPPVIDDTFTDLDKMFHGGYEALPSYFGMAAFVDGYKPEVEKIYEEAENFEILSYADYLTALAIDTPLSGLTVVTTLKSGPARTPVFTFSTGLFDVFAQSQEALSATLQAGQKGPNESCEQVSENALDNALNVAEKLSAAVRMKITVQGQDVLSFGSKAADVFELILKDSDGNELEKVKQTTTSFVSDYIGNTVDVVTFFDSGDVIRAFEKSKLTKIDNMIVEMKIQDSAPGFRVGIENVQILGETYACKYSEVEILALAANGKSTCK